MLDIPKILLAQIISYAQEGYPDEVCGLLSGKTDGADKKILGVHPVLNTNEDRKNDRYSLDPKGYALISHEAHEKGEEILGIYHSHPDHPAKPSGTDLKQAWPVYSYLICSITKEKGASCQAWTLNEEKKEFVEEPIKILGG
jgi:proteasome lid subunit RPN8/RPN11